MRESLKPGGLNSPSQTSDEDMLLQDIEQLEEQFITKAQMKELLFQINYLPFLLHQSKYNIDSNIMVDGQRINKGSNLKEEVEAAKWLLDAMWSLLNFEKQDKIQR